MARRCPRLHLLPPQPRLLRLANDACSHPATSPAKWSLSGPIIGIDLGTRYSRLGLVVSEERVQIIQAPDGMREIPSDVCFAHNKTFVGHADILRCSQIGGTTVHNIRDLIRHGFTSQHPDILAPYKRTEINRLPTPAKIPSPPQLSPSALTLIAAVLHELRMMAERFHGAPVSQAVITVPLDFDETERRVINEAALLAGLSPVHLLDEPIAVAIAYGLDAPPALSYAVVLDVGVAARATVLRIEARDIQVVATLQNRSLGGDAFNRLLFAHGSDAYRASIHDSLDAVQAVVLEDQVEEAKLKLSFDRDTVIALPIQGGPWFLVPLSRDTFDMIAADLVEAIIARTIDPMLRGAGVPPSAIKHVILAGGSANIPALRARLRQHFPASIHLNVQDPYPEEAVVYGAAMFARRLALGQVPEESRIYTQNMTPMRFGIEGTGGVFATLIPRNSALPARNTRRFRLSGRAVRVFTGTAEYTNSTEFLGSVVLPPNMNPTRLKITFELSTLGVLNVTAADDQGRSHSALFAPRRPSPLELSRMHTEATVAAEREDVQRRMQTLRVHLAQYRPVLRRHLRKLRPRDPQRALRAQVADAMDVLDGWIAKHILSASREQFLGKLAVFEEVLKQDIIVGDGDNDVVG